MYRQAHKLPPRRAELALFAVCLVIILFAVVTLPWS